MKGVEIKMQRYRGKSVFEGIAMGKIRVYRKDETQLKPIKVQNTEGELERYFAAKRTAAQQLKQLYEKAVRQVGEAGAAVFEVHGMLLEDGEYNRSVESIIREEHVNAEYAVSMTGEKLSERFVAMEDDYIASKAADVKDISRRLVEILQRNNDVTGSLQASVAEAEEPSEPVIVVAEDLSPSETIQMNKDNVLAFVTVKGSACSHTAILAGMMGIPALVRTELSPDASMDGQQGIVDGYEGVFYVEPEAELEKQMRIRRDAELEKKKQLRELVGKRSITADGKQVMLCANIGNIGDLKAVLENDADGIGLFRSEFIYLGRNSYPTEEEQFLIYKAAAEAMNGKPIIIRTLDIGADKQCDYFHLEKEENPALGCRAIRICLKRPEIFRTQLRALFRASVYGNIAIMYPMITGVREMKRIQEIAAEVKKELRAGGIAFGEPKQGIMIETPAAVMMSDELAKEADFFSIGTNDLIQYTLAMDRQNAGLEEYCDSHYPAVLRMIEIVVKNAHKAGIPVGICGELGADREFTREFLALGVDELSVSPESILPLRKLIRQMNVEEI